MRTTVAEELLRSALHAGCRSNIFCAVATPGLVFLRHLRVLSVSFQPARVRYFTILVSIYRIRNGQ